MIRNERDVKAHACPDGKDRVDVGVDGTPGLQLRVSKTAKAWRLKSKAAGTRSLGRWPDVSLLEAKAAAAVLIGQAARKRVNEAAGAPVLAVVDRRTLRALMDTHGAGRGAALASWEAQRAMIENRYREWLDRPAARVTEAVVLGPVERERNVASVRAARYLSTLLRRYRVGGPVDGRTLAEFVTERPRQRVLTDDEIRRVLRADVREPWKDFTRFLLVTAARRSDAARARSEDFDLEAGVWNRRVSKARWHGTVVERYPLSRQALEMVEGRSGWIFRTSRGPIRGNWTAALARLHEASDTEGWTWHDLRRTARTLLSRTSVPPHVAERFLGHAVGSVIVRTYDVYEYRTELSEAAQVLADLLDRLEGH
jgi:integrase